MSEVLTAIYRDGAFVPEQVTSVPLGTRVRLIVESLPSDTDVRQSLDEFDALCDEVDICAPGTHLTRDQLHERD
jgi:predicted DNA-binding antitoxin AbrB/MazE fold protein